MSKFINMKESLTEIIEKNNLEILKIDLYNDEAAIAKSINMKPNKSCKIYTTLESLDFEEDFLCWHDEVQGIVYCQDKDTKEPVWIESRGDEGSSWWEVNRVPDFYKNN